MAQRKKTPEELELAAHNRLKGTISYHIASAQSQLACIKRKLTDYKSGAEFSELDDIDSLVSSLTHIEAATQKFKEITYSRLSIGNSPSSNRTNTKKKIKPYAT